MSGSTDKGVCDVCGAQRSMHAADVRGLKLICPNGVGRFRWKVVPGRASTSFGSDEIEVLSRAVHSARLERVRAGYQDGHGTEGDILLMLARKMSRLKLTAATSQPGTLRLVGASDAE